MNITGYGQYSKETTGLRNVRDLKDSKNFINMQHKLIFIYPMLFADKIKVPNIEILLRDFIAVTFLSDIFVQNVFNTIGIANQIRPLWDENKKPVDVSTAIWKEYQSQQGIYSTGANPPNYPVGAEYTGVVQQKINQKTAVIQQLIKSDPKMAKTRPFIEVITLGNLIDVPVIVGTAPYPVNPLYLMYVLIAAVALRKSLSNPKDVDYIFHELETLDEPKYWSLLSRLTSTPEEKGDLADWLREFAYKNLKKFGNIRAIPSMITRTTDDWATRLRNRIMKPPELNPQHRLLSPLILNKTELDQTKLYFKFVLDPELPKQRFGIETGVEKTNMERFTSIKFGTQLTHVREVTMGKFEDLISTIGISLLSSISTLIAIDEPTTDFSKQRSESIDLIYNAISEQLKDITTQIQDGLIQETVSGSMAKIETLKDLCAIDSPEKLKMYIDNTFINSVPVDFDRGKFISFLQFFNDFVKISEAMSFKMEKEVRYIAPTEQQEIMLGRLNDIKEIIKESINTFFKENTEDLAEFMKSRLGKLVEITNINIKDKLLPSFKAGLVQIFYFMFLAKLQESLCRFILTAEVDVETTSNEVTTWPNYVLVLPVEIILALHAATMGASWKHMLQGGEPGKPVRKKDIIDDEKTTSKNTPLTKEDISTRSVFNPNETYIKGIIKYVSQNIGVPNLIVVDSKRGDIYYKLMNQTDINKTRIATIETFIQSKLNRQVVSNTNYY